MFDDNVFMGNRIFAAAECTYFISMGNLYYTGKPSFIGIKKSLIPKFICELKIREKDIKYIAVADNGFFAILTNDNKLHLLNGNKLKSEQYPFEVFTISKRHNISKISWGFCGEHSRIYALDENTHKLLRLEIIYKNGKFKLQSGAIAWHEQIGAFDCCLVDPNNTEVVVIAEKIPHFRIEGFSRVAGYFVTRNGKFDCIFTSINKVRVEEAVQQISVSATHTDVNEPSREARWNFLCLLLTKNNKVYALGDNSSGAFGPQNKTTFICKMCKMQLGGYGRVKQICAGHSYTAILFERSKLVVFGTGLNAPIQTNSLLGSIGATIKKNVSLLLWSPIKKIDVPETSVIAISAGLGNLFLQGDTNNGFVYCLGNNHQGQLGLGNTISYLPQIERIKNFVLKSYKTPLIIKKKYYDARIITEK